MTSDWQAINHKSLRRRLAAYDLVVGMRQNRQVCADHVIGDLGQGKCYLY